MLPQLTAVQGPLEVARKATTRALQSTRSILFVRKEPQSALPFRKCADFDDFFAYDSVMGESRQLPYGCWTIFCLGRTSGRVDDAESSSGTSQEMKTGFERHHRDIAELQ